MSEESASIASDERVGVVAQRAGQDQGVSKERPRTGQHAERAEYGFAVRKDLAVVKEKEGVCGRRGGCVVCEEVVGEGGFERRCSIG